MKEEMQKMDKEKGKTCEHKNKVEPIFGATSLIIRLVAFLYSFYTIISKFVTHIT